MTKPTRWCKACGGQGWLDEDQAQRLGVRIIEGRTDTCPRCKGTGAPGEADSVFVVAGVMIGLLLAAYAAAFIIAWSHNG